MPGGGTKLDTTLNSPPPARLFELTRTLSLFSGVPSGVDRVCFAYLKALCDAPEPAFGLAKTTLGYVLLDKTGMQEVLQRLEGEKPWGRPDFLSRLMHKPNHDRRHTEAELRRLCIARCRPLFLGHMLRKHMPDGTAYINVDQANMPSRTLKAVKSVPRARFVPFLHDTIPLDFPQYQTAQSIERFELMMKRIQRSANAILCNSNAVAADITRHMEVLGPVPPIHVAHLGIEEPHYFQNGDNEGAPKIPKPYFVLLGTIEPRKNHKLILDIWEALETELPAQDMPHLAICGRRGWMNDEVFQLLDSGPQKDRFVHEFNTLDDLQMQKILAGAAGCLFPSICEGFGLPPAEAAARGIPVICNTLPVLREFLADIPIYASVADSYAWKEAIIELAQQARARGDTQGQDTNKFVPPTWQSHFNVVLKVT